MRSVEALGANYSSGDDATSSPFDRNFEWIVEVLVPQIGEEVVEVVRNMAPEVLKVTPHELAFQRILERIVEILVARIGKEIWDVMQITPLEVLNVFCKTSLLRGSICEEWKSV